MRRWSGCITSGGAKIETWTAADLNSNRACGSTRGRAVWLAEPKVLIVADLHLGYAWAHRADGQLLPVERRRKHDGAAARSAQSLSPRANWSCSGDILHRAVEAPGPLYRVAALAGPSMSVNGPDCG